MSNLHLQPYHNQVWILSERILSRILKSGRLIPCHFPYTIANIIGHLLHSQISIYQQQVKVAIVQPRVKQYLLQSTVILVYLSHNSLFENVAEDAVCYTQSRFILFSDVLAFFQLKKPLRLFRKESLDSLNPLNRLRKSLIKTLNHEDLILLQREQSYGPKWHERGQKI